MFAFVFSFGQMLAQATQALSSRETVGTQRAWLQVRGGILLL